MTSNKYQKNTIEIIRSLFVRGSWKKTEKSISGMLCVCVYNELEKIFVGCISLSLEQKKVYRDYFIT